ncbi:hypothetical protein FD30_GL000339 [Levilactobacillus namurensis DSM 19117]|uniref:DUF2187 domain-containing protein n=2 Tax=Levilactobacillus namurensis TaxID=380393 RepID=A0A0R1JQN0_9LACO|nr:hypothetical protein [Levilactobacillus namurensis]PTM21410.1 hypothetical protein DA798_10390 [Lactobacillus sp. PFC-70]KRK73631.1 hypothetical protein FD30_GL000339 [Levilactobacillus namurensis DSM 19117]MCW3779065.1 hypothetical protein [Levilactobacillus namurensis]MDT7013675.1 hypothetical protein [Levilactobacillus namurensis]MDT7019461.1 hypothetical protein [Levilactobacillus namurensis]
MALHENDRVYCKETELFSDAFYGTITKIYEHAALVKVEPDQLKKKETDKIDSFGDLVVIRQTELQLVDENGAPLPEPEEKLEAAE